MAYIRLPMSAAIQYRSRSDPLPGYCHFEACILHPQAVELAMSDYGPRIRKVQPRINTVGLEWPKQIKFSISA